MKTIIVQDAQGTRLDRFLKRSFPDLTQGVIEKLLRKKDILHNNQKARSSDKLTNGDEIAYFAKAFLGADNINHDISEQSSFQEDKSYDTSSHPSSLTEGHDHRLDLTDPNLRGKFSDQEKSSSAKFSSGKFSSGVISLAKKLLNEYLIFECDHFIAINKPHGLASQGGSKISVSVADALSYLNSNKVLINRFRQKKFIDQDFEVKNQELDLKIVHRLDKDTSGVLLIAKGYENAASLSEAFRDRIIKKEYLALVEGVPRQEQGIISGIIGKKPVKFSKSENKPNFEKVISLSEEDSEGRLAITEYKVVKLFHKSPLTSKYVQIEILPEFDTQIRQIDHEELYSLIEYKPQTGRMHQLRIHSKLLGCPILGDIKYGGSKSERMMLHSRRIIIPLEIFGVQYDIIQDLDISADQPRFL